VVCTENCTAVTHVVDKPDIRKIEKASAAPLKTLEANVQKNAEIETWLMGLESESSQQQRLSKLFKYELASKIIIFRRLAKQAHEQATILEKLEEQSRNTRDKINTIDNQINNMTHEISAWNAPRKQEFSLELRALPNIFSEPFFDKVLMVAFLVITALCGAVIFAINFRALLTEIN